MDFYEFVLINVNHTIIAKKASTTQAKAVQKPTNNIIDHLTKMCTNYLQIVLQSPIILHPLTINLDQKHPTLKREE